MGETCQETFESIYNTPKVKKTVDENEARNEVDESENEREENGNENDRKNAIDENKREEKVDANEREEGVNENDRRNAIDENKREEKINANGREDNNVVLVRIVDAPEQENMPPLEEHDEKDQKIKVEPNQMEQAKYFDLKYLIDVNKFKRQLINLGKETDWEQIEGFSLQQLEGYILALGLNMNDLIKSNVELSDSD